MNEIGTVGIVGIIGAGIAGLSCAARLRRAGIQSTVLEKSRGVGGRLATRRFESGATFDHGAQYFTVRDELFATQVKEWLSDGTAILWPGRIVSLNNGAITELHESRERYIGVPGMNAIAKSLAVGIDVQTNVNVRSVHRTAGKWQLEDNAANLHGPFDWLVSTAPAPQTRTLWENLSPSFAGPLSCVTMNPCWAVMMQFADPLPTAFDAAFVQDSPLNWIARNSSKPGRAPGECWVLHASSTWSIAHLEATAETIASALAAAFWQATGQGPMPLTALVAHRWRYALPVEPLQDRFLLDKALQLGACGDWCGGPRVEGAYLSGHALAEAVLAAQ